MLKIFILTTLLSLCSFLCIFPQSFKIPSINFSPQKYICYYTNQQPNIDGKLEETIWEKVPWSDYFVDIRGDSFLIPTYNTRAKMLWDENYFYIAAELEEPDVWAAILKRDSIIFQDNAFEIFIDPDGDTHNYCELQLNAFNTIWDILLLKPYRDAKNAANSEWNINDLKTAVSVDGTLNDPSDKDRGWTIEIALPWKTFIDISTATVPPEDGDQWRINFARVQWKLEVSGTEYQKKINPLTNKPYPEDYWVWSPQGIVNLHYPEMWGFVQFSKNIAGINENSFIVKEEESARWLLRKIYYQQKKYFDENGKFTNDLNELSIQDLLVPGYKMPKIETTKYSFEVSIESDDRSKKIFIRDDGLIWQRQNSYENRMDNRKRKNGALKKPNIRYEFGEKIVTAFKQISKPNAFN
ncbi:MAG: carbohydrate-binding family 9-like protein [Bacteroidota bacterium]